MQFQVPQFIDTEDKIVGPLSIRQFIYVVVAAGASVLLYFSVQTWLWATLSLPLLAIGGALAFAKVNGRPFAKFLMATISFYWKPQTYVWQAEKLHQGGAAGAGGAAKNAEAAGSGGFSVEKLLAGMALKKAWNKVQTGSAAPEESGASKSKLKGQKPAKERYQVFHKISGEQQAAKRVDYR